MRINNRSKWVWSLLVFLAWGCSTQSGSDQSEEVQTVPSFQTVSNPMNLSYRFRPELPSRREAADPTVIKFKGDYFLFASKSGGYWYSKDLADWTFVETSEIPTEDYAPTTIVLGDKVYMAVSSKKNNTVYSSSDPKSGKWQASHALPFAVEDPAFFLDTDNRLYLYWGCSNVKPLYAAEIDKKTFQFLSETSETIFPNPAQLGFEVRGDYNDEYDNAPWLEGSWMNKHKGKYYLQYSAPGTREKSYADGVYESDHPLGPFTLAVNNPFSYKPEGFACGAGHGSTFYDDYGNLWHTGTISVSVKHKFERRIGFFPAFFDTDGVLHTVNKYGDYPVIIPDKRIESFDEIFPGWMLLSYNKPVEVSSAIDSLSPANANDENIRTYWAAQSGAAGEWLSVDLGESSSIYAIQANFAEHHTHILNRQPDLRHQYVVEGSDDKANWQVILDKSNNESDRSHDYTQLSAPVNYRYVRIKNVKVPDGNFAISGLRIFGKGSGAKPTKVIALDANRSIEDRRMVTLKWSESDNATGYNISFGSHPDKLYHSYMVYADTEVTIRSLDSKQPYYFTIESFNENGITPSEISKQVE